MAKKIEELTQKEFDQFNDRLSTMQAKTIRFAVELADDMGIDRDDCVHEKILLLGMCVTYIGIVLVLVDILNPD